MPDASGVEPLEGESEADYVARQARLREEAAARMRAKFGASGGLNGGVRMGGIGSSNGGGGGVSSSDLLSSLGGGLTTAASGASWLFGKAADSASSAVSSARESLQQRASFDASRDLGHLSRRGGGGNGVPEGSRDLSDLLGGVGLDAPAEPSATSSPPGGRTVGRANGQGAAPDASWDDEDESWGAPGGGMEPNAAAEGSTAVAPASGHYAGASSATPNKRKVAAVKVKGGDKAWDDWGEDKW